MQKFPWPRGTPFWMRGRADAEAGIPVRYAPATPPHRLPRLRSQRGSREVLQLALQYTAGNILAATLLAAFFFPLASVSADDDIARSYAELDRGIVQAYNSNPKNTALVYVKSVRILKKTEQDDNSTGAAWRLKAQKLITVSCFYECTKAIDKKLYRQAYIWARRGIKRGTTFGQIGDTPVNNLYSYLAFAESELQNTPMVRDSDPNELQNLIDDDNRTSFGPELRSMTSIESLRSDILLACIRDIVSHEIGQTRLEKSDRVVK